MRENSHRAWIKNLTNQTYLAYGLSQSDADTGVLAFDYALVGERVLAVSTALTFSERAWRNCAAP